MSSKINMKCILDWNALEGGLGIINKCMEWGLMPREMKCPRCNKPGSVFTLIKASNSPDSYRWYCSNMRSAPKKKRKRCNSRLSLRTGTVFARSKLAIWQILCFFLLWTKNVPLTVIMEETEMSSQTAISLSFFCSKIVNDLLTKRNQKIGGPGKEVQIAKNNFSKSNGGQWVLGGIDSSTGECFLEPVEDLNAQTILPLIKKNIEVGSTIISDGFEAYDGLGDLGYHHIKVDPCVNSVDPETGAHRNNIVATWHAIKSSMPKYGRRKEFLGNFLSKYVFLKYCKLNKLDSFVEMCKEMGDQYNPSSDQTILEVPVDDFVNNMADIGDHIYMADIGNY